MSSKSKVHTGAVVAASKFDEELSEFTISFGDGATNKLRRRFMRALKSSVPASLLSSVTHQGANVIARLANPDKLNEAVEAIRRVLYSVLHPGKRALQVATVSGPNNYARTDYRRRHNNQNS